MESVQYPWREKKSDSIFKVWKRSDRKQQKKARRTPKRISLDQAIVPNSMPSPPRTFMNCSPANDLELRFRGTILYEMDDLDQTPPEQTLIFMNVSAKRNAPPYFYLSETSFLTLKLKNKSFFHKDLFVSNSYHKVVCNISSSRQRYVLEMKDELLIF